MGRQKPNKPRRPRCTSAPAPATQACAGQQLDHKDGSMSCSTGTACPGVALPHNGWRDCDAFGPCAYCEGPRTDWI